MKGTFPKFKQTAITTAVASLLSAAPGIVVAQEEAEVEGFERIEVTATRRASTVQEAPLNITALDSDVLRDQDISDLKDVARWVPGLTVQDQGGRSSSPIIVRGLNTNSSGPGSDGGTVATYVGEIPMFVDMKLIDIDRVEVLIGPQGTLYGAGTLGGAIRYIPKKAELDVTEGEIYGDIFSIAEGGTGGEAGFVFNTPIIEDELGFRMAVNYFNDPGFIDYNYVVKQGGTSLPDPWLHGEGYDQHLKQVEDANGEKTLTTRMAVRWTPTEDIDATLTYLYQNQDVEGRSITHHNALATTNKLQNVGEYTSAYRYEEPREKTDELLALEVSVDLGFAELVSATGFSKFEALGQRDQTDLLIRLDYSYEAFPAFSSFTREVDEEETFTQEIRLVSQSDSDLSWIVGAFYYDEEDFGDSREYTPGFGQFAVDNWGAAQTRPDALEYISVGTDDIKEKAIFGEVAYQVNDKLAITVGARFYDYEVSSESAISLPLLGTLWSGADPTAINLDFSTVGAEDDGNLLKFNANYQMTDDAMVYVTLSEGFRIGGSNGVGACPDNINEIDNQIVCALPNEVIYLADTTTNYELGFKTSWNKNRLYLNGAFYRVEWDDAQISGATINGQQPITSNGDGAESSGFELSARAMLTDSVKAYATYSHTSAELTADAPFLFGVIDEQGTPLQNHYDGKNGDRLPGSPETQISFGLSYSQEIMGDLLMDINYGLTYQSDLITRVGQRADGETIPGYALSNISATFSSDENWSVTAYINNMFDKFAYTSTRGNLRLIGQSKFDERNGNRSDLLRSYGHYVLTPRTVGVRFNYTFGD